MAPKKRRPQPCGDCGASEGVSAGRFDTLRFNPQPHKKQDHLHRDNFARDAVFAEFGYRHARALDYDAFVDRVPNQTPLWWRAAL